MVLTIPACHWSSEVYYRFHVELTLLPSILFSYCVAMRASCFCFFSPLPFLPLTCTLVYILGV
jgi:hypothetical protein